MPELNTWSDSLDINSVATYLAQAGDNVVYPETFYTKQLLDTIRLDASHYVYYRLASPLPIEGKAGKVQIRRWSPLQAHTVPLEEGVPPVTDKGSVEKFEFSGHQYGRYMEFTDQVDFQVVDPVIAHYTQEYTLVAMETLDLLARDAMLAVAQKYYAGGVATFEDLKIDSIPTLEDLRIIVLNMKKLLVKPRTGTNYEVIISPEFAFDLVSDPLVEKYMQYNQTTKDVYSSGTVPPLFNMTFSETMCVPTHGKFVKSATESIRYYVPNADPDQVTYETKAITDTPVSGYVKDAKTGADGSYIPNQPVYADATSADAKEFKVQHILVIGKDALVRTGLSGEDNAKMYVKPLGSAGVLDPINQRQSIGFKINNVGFGVPRLEAVTDYMCVPSQVNV